MLLMLKANKGISYFNASITRIPDNMYLDLSFRHVTLLCQAGRLWQSNSQHGGQKVILGIYQEMNPRIGQSLSCHIWWCFHRDPPPEVVFYLSPRYFSFNNVENSPYPSQQRNNCRFMVLESWAMKDRHLAQWHFWWMAKDRHWLLISVEQRGHWMVDIVSLPVSCCLYVTGRMGLLFFLIT